LVPMTDKNPSRWRKKYKVHPAADVWPMMPSDELDALGEDIKANGLKQPIMLWSPDKLEDLRGKGVWPDAYLLDGRNRLEAMERAGIDLADNDDVIRTLFASDPYAYVMSANLHRRHMLKSERADAIVALAKMSAEKPDHVDPVSKGGRGKKSAVKARALEINAALPKEQRVSEPTIKRSIAKAEGKTPKPKAKPKVGDEQWNELVREGRKITGYRTGDGNDPPEQAEEEKEPAPEPLKIEIEDSGLKFWVLTDAQYTPYKQWSEEHAVEVVAHSEWHLTTTDHVRAFYAMELANLSDEERAAEVERLEAAVKEQIEARTNDEAAERASTWILPPPSRTATPPRCQSDAR
jgi:hypothetical protein